MRVWRLCKAEHAATALTGEGAILYAGRWHHAGTAVVDCSESRALAALEQLVHLHRNRLPPHFVCFGVEIPEDLDIRKVQTQELPTEWRLQPGPQPLRDLGTRWAARGETAVLRAPSAVVPGEHNFLLNPRHPDFSRLRISHPEAFEFDVRLLGSGSRGVGRRLPRRP
jgi:RES domain-containing protein